MAVTRENSGTVASGSNVVGTGQFVDDIAGPGAFTFGARLVSGVAGDSLGFTIYKMPLAAGTAAVYLECGPWYDTHSAEPQEAEEAVMTGLTDATALRLWVVQLTGTARGIEWWIDKAA